MEIIKPHCEKGEFLVGDKLTIADFALGGIYTNYLANEHISFAKDRFAEFLSKHPYFEEYGKRYTAAVSDYLDSRPAYQV